MNLSNPSLWRTCRVIANDTRLNLLRILLEKGEDSVTTLGKRTGIPTSHASLHLRLLNSRGLITSRSESKWVYYSATPNRSVEYASPILNALTKSFADTSTDNSHVFAIATAFTHPRRIVIAKSLQQEAMPARALSLRTQIPLCSLHRHLNKLVARRIVAFEKDRYILGKPAKPLDKTLLSIAIQQH